MPLKVLLLFLFSFQLLAQTKDLAFIGGGGEDPGTKTIFDTEVDNIGIFSNDKNNHWRIQASFNGGHSETEQKLNRGVGKKGAENRAFTNESFEAIISEYETKIQSGEIRKGDQILLYISTHGARQITGETSHQIATTGAIKNYENLSGSKTVSLDRLKSLIKLAEEKNIKLGILDFSCHSGNTLNLASLNTCIISSSGPNHFGWAGNNLTFSARFSAHMKPGRNLEEVFLSAFSDRHEAGFPMISTPVGRELQKELYEKLTPFLYDWHSEKSMNKLTGFLEKEVLENKCINSELNFQEIIALSKEVETIANKSGKKESLEDFREAVTAYHALQVQMRNDLIAMNIKSLKESHQFCQIAEIKLSTFTSKQQRCNNYTVGQLLSINFDEYTALLLTQTQSKDAFERGFATAELRNIEAAKVKRDQIIASNPEMLKYENYYKSIPGLQENTRTMSKKVSLEFQKVYDRLYRSRSAQSNYKNPCKDFVL